MSKFNNWLDHKHRKLISTHCTLEHVLSPFCNFHQGFDNLKINPLIDLIEDENSFKIEIEMPGVDENDIQLSIINNVLNIKASKEISKKNESKNYAMREIGYGSYERSISLSDDVDIDKAESTFKKGTLWVTFPKKAVNKRKIRVLEIKKIP